MRRRRRRRREVQIESPTQATDDDRSWFDRRPRLTLVIGVVLTAAVMGLMYDAWRDPRPVVVRDRPSLFGAPRDPGVIQSPAPDPEHQTSLADADPSKSRRPGGGKSGSDPRLADPLRELREIQALNARAQQQAGPNPGVPGLPGIPNGPSPGNPGSPGNPHWLPPGTHTPWPGR